jgi:hypothetical protein
MREDDFFMKNTKVIILSGFARGGTNIAWNLMQSHPEICSPIHETGELFRKSWALSLCRFMSEKTVFTLCKYIVDAQLFKFKLQTLEHPDNKFIAEGKLYTNEQVVNAVLCLKSVNYDIFLTDLLLRVYPDLYFIALARSGYALCDGYIRSGGTATEAGILYNRIAEKMKRYADLIPHFKMIKFEEILQRPFDVAEKVFAFVDVYPQRLEKLRLKSKKVINTQNEHRVTFGTENRKYWFDRSMINQILDPSVNQTQIERLPNSTIDEFSRTASPALKFFGYERYS